MCLSLQHVSYACLVSSSTLSSYHRCRNSRERVQARNQVMKELVSCAFRDRYAANTKVQCGREAGVTSGIKAYTI